MALQQELAIDIHQKLDQGGQLDNRKPWTNYSIYKVPSWMKDGERPNDDRTAGYVPEIISFGPYHCGQSHLQQMEDHKWRVLNHMLKREGHDIALYLTAVEEVENEARACYESAVSLTSKQFVEMMVLDGCFVLEFLGGKAVDGYHNLGYEDDPVFCNDAICHVIEMDLIKLENQIPLIILQKLIQVQYGRDVEIEEVPRLVMSVLTPNCVAINDPTTKEQLNYMRNMVATKHGSEPMVHCLDVFRESLIYKPQVPLNTWCGRRSIWDNYFKRKAKPFEKDCEHFMANSVSDLREAGIKFKPGNKLPFWDIKFEQSSGVLKIHPFKIDHSTETVFRNLIAFEQCHMLTSRERVVSDYVAFMDNLINTASDVAYLHEAEIIVHYLGSDQEVADLFNRLVTKAYVNKKMGGLQDVYLKLNEYCSHRRNWWRASLQNEYLHNPWVIISIFAALLLFILTVIQTFYAIYAYYKPPS